MRVGTTWLSTFMRTEMHLRMFPAKNTICLRDAALQKKCMHRDCLRSLNPVPSPPPLPFHAPSAGPNLRRLYLPGLEGLKVELRRFDWLLARRLPNLSRYLDAHGVVPVLYASQWFLTAFSCPFPVAFSCQIVGAWAWGRHMHMCGWVLHCFFVPFGAA
jgi:hypothetical protein